jgi:hypothetical protein
MQLNLNGGAGCGVTEDGAIGAMVAVSGATGSRRPRDKNREIVLTCIGVGRQANFLPVIASLVSNQGLCTSILYIDNLLPDPEHRSGEELLSVSCELYPLPKVLPQSRRSDTFIPAEAGIQSRCPRDFPGSRFLGNDA